MNHYHKEPFESLDTPEIIEISEDSNDDDDNEELCENTPKYK